MCFECIKKDVAHVDSYMSNKILRTYSSTIWVVLVPRNYLYDYHTKTKYVGLDCDYTFIQVFWCHVASTLQLR